MSDLRAKDAERAIEMVVHCDRTGSDKTTTDHFLADAARRMAILARSTAPGSDPAAVDMMREGVAGLNLRTLEVQS
jgi:hypothetical protein